MLYKNFVFSCSHCFCTIFVLPSYSLYTQDMLILTLINVQYLENVAFSLKKGLSGQNHSLWDSHHLIEKFVPDKFSISPPLNAVWKTLDKGPSLLKFVCLFQVKLIYSWKYFFHSSIMTSKLHWFIKWTVIKICLKTIWNSHTSFYLNIIEKRHVPATPYFCIVHWKHEILK